jgi:hypothetical protein
MNQIKIYITNDNRFMHWKSCKKEVCTFVCVAYELYYPASSNRKYIYYEATQKNNFNISETFFMGFESYW